MCNLKERLLFLQSWHGFVMHDNADISCLLIGDFNIIRSAADKNKPVVTNNWSFIFNVIIENTGLRDLPLNGRNFTWANNLDIPTFERLDRAMICPDWEEKYPLTMLYALQRDFSDHTPLITDSGQINKSNYIFQLENAWFEREGFDDLVKKVWLENGDKGSSIDRWQNRHRMLRKNLKGWNKNVGA